MNKAAEKSRLGVAQAAGTPWKKWGPYLSERQWGTVREDYSHDGNAWAYFPFEHARSRAYRWGEDGLAGISDDRQQLCFRACSMKMSFWGLTASDRSRVSMRVIPICSTGTARTTRWATSPVNPTQACLEGILTGAAPVWMPANFLILRALRTLYTYYGDDFTVECPTGSGQLKTLFEIEEGLRRRLTAIFLKNSQGTRPVYGEEATFQHNPHWRDHILFYEYFNGDTGAGIGASHQTGWTGLLATLLTVQADLSAADLLEGGTQASSTSESFPTVEGFFSRP